MDAKSVLFFVLGLLTLGGTLISCALFMLLQFLILKQINADTACWLVYWAYVPCSVGVRLLPNVLSVMAKNLLKP